MPLTAPLWHATRLGRRLIMGALLLPVLASSQTVGDKALLDMRAAYSRGQSAELARLLPTVRGHVLEPLARYWDMRVRLDTASPTEIRAALDAMAGTYWEDRLRNDWLLQLGKRRDWARFEACAAGCAAASSTAWPANSAPPRSRSATTATTSCRRCCSTCSSAPSSRACRPSW